MKQLRIDTQENIYSDYMKLIKQYDNPAFICNRQSKKEIWKFQYPNGEYMWSLCFKTDPFRETLFGKTLIEDENIDGLFIMENNCK